MFSQQILRDVFLVVYGAVAALNLCAGIYLLLRRANAIAPAITSSVRLRRCAAAFFAAAALSHLWNLPALLLTGADARQAYIVAGLLDSLTIVPLALAILLAMLQDRPRPLWLAFAAVAPLVAILAWCVVGGSDGIPLSFYVCSIVAITYIAIYMTRALRQYGRWLRDNYADLEHKEVWQSFVVLAFILLSLSVYTFDSNWLLYEYFLQVLSVALVCYLLWRVETLSELNSNTAHDVSQPVPEAEIDSPLSVRSNIGPLLKQHCEDCQLYLQHDISVTQLAALIGTNRVYLSKHFAAQGTTYNAYINGLRIRHFVALYREATAARMFTTVQQLAHQSGFRSYGTFNTAFKQVMGMTATEWMRSAAE